MRFYRGPLKWIDLPNEPQRWEGPLGANCLDTRTIEQQSKQGGPEQAVLFVSNTDVDDSDYELIADGAPEEIKLTRRMKQLLPTRKGYQLRGDTLSQAIADLFQGNADPDGIDGPKPLMPANGRFTVDAGRAFYEELFRFGHGDKHNLVKTMVQRQIKDASEQVDRGELKAEMLPKILGYELRKYGLQKTDWQEFVPQNLRQRIDRAADPETTISDDFNRADGDLGANWSSAAGWWSVTSNTARKVSNAATARAVVHQTALSGADHYAQLKLVAGTANTLQAPIVRKVNNTTLTCYCCGGYDNTLYLIKFVSSAQTNLTTAVQTYAAGDVYKCEIVGSALKGYVNAVQKLSTTETAITGNTYCGMSQLAPDTSGTIDDFYAEDTTGGGGGGGLIYTQLERTLRGVNRGVWSK
jgi:hypothetical protein